MPEFRLEGGQRANLLRATISKNCQKCPHFFLIYQWSVAWWRNATVAFQIFCSLLNFFLKESFPVFPVFPIFHDKNNILEKKWIATSVEIILPPVVFRKMNQLHTLNLAALYAQYSSLSHSRRRYLFWILWYALARWQRGCVVDLSRCRDTCERVPGNTRVLPRCEEDDAIL